MNYVLIAVLLILIITALLGYRRGLVKTVFSLVSMIAALILTVIISPYVSGWMKNSETISNYVTDNVKEIISVDDVDTNRKTDEEVIESLELPEFLESTLLENNTAVIYNELEVQKNNVLEYIIAGITNILINAIAFVATYIIIRVLLWLICYMLDVLAKLPVLKQINKVTGLAAGLAQGLLCVWIFCILIMVFGFGDFGAYVYKSINESSILTFIYDSNLLVSAVTRLQ